MIHKRILVTETRDKDGNTHFFYGRYDAVKLASDGMTIVNSHFEMRKMTETMFYSCSELEKEITK